MASETITDTSVLTLDPFGGTDLIGSDAIVLGDSDPADAGATYTVTVTDLGAGQLSASFVGMPIAVASGGKSATVTGTLNQVDATLLSLQLSEGNKAGTDTLSVTASVGGSTVATRDIAVISPASNTTAPTIDAPTTVAAPANQATPLAVSVLDTVARAALGGDFDTVTITASAGVLLLNGTGSDGASFENGGSGTETVTLSGSIQRIETDLATLAYVGNGQNAQITVEADDFATPSAVTTVDVVGAPQTAAASQIYQWSSSVASGAFGTSADWTPAGVPDTTDTALFESGRYAVSGAGAAGEVVIDGAAVVETGSLLAAGLSGPAILVDDGGSLALTTNAAVTADAGTIIGEAAAGTLTLDSLSVLDPTGLSTTTLVLGDQAGSSGTMSVGASLWSSSGTVVVGQDGTGLLTIGDESDVVIGSLEVAAGSGSSGLVMVEGNATRFDVDGDVSVGGTDAGAGGTGTLLIGPDVSATITGGLTIQNQGVVRIQAGDIDPSAITVEAGGLLTGDAPIGLANSDTITNDGTIEAPADGNFSGLQLNNAVAGTGTLLIDDNATLDIAGAIGDGQTIAFGSDSTLVASTTAIAGTVSGFKAGDSIQFEQLAAALTGVTYDPSTGMATVTDANDNVFTLHFAGTYTADDFAVYGGNTIGLAQPIGIAAQASLATVQGLSTPLLGLNVVDLDPNSFIETTTVTVTNGTLSDTNAEVSAVLGPNSQSLTITAAKGGLAQALAGIVYTAPSLEDDPSGLDSLAISVTNDEPNGSVTTSTIIPVTINLAAASEDWSGAGDGSFADPNDWTTQQAPGTGDLANFGTGTYTVSGVGDVGAMQIGDDALVTFTGPISASDTSGETPYSVAVQVDGGARAILAVGATLETGSSVVVGETGAGTLQMAGGTGAITGNLVLGAQASADGNYVADSATTVSGDVVVGAAGTGDINLDGEPAGLSDSDAVLGQQAGSVGDATVSGAVWNSTGTFTVGEAGTGVVRIDPTIFGDSGPIPGVVDTSGIVGAEAGSTGSVTLDQGIWTNATSLVIGEAGTADVQLLNGAQVSTSSQPIGGGTVAIAADAGSVGTVEVTGGSAFSAYGNIAIGGTDAAAGGQGHVTIGEFQGDSATFGATGTVTIWGTGSVTMENGLTEPGTATATDVILQAPTLDIASGGVLSGDGEVLGAGNAGYIAGPNQIPNSAFTLATIANDGSIEATGGRLLLYGNVSGSGTTSIAQGAQLELQGSSSADQTAQFVGGDAQLTIDDVTDYASTIDGFAGGDTIYLPGVAETSVAWNDGTLTLSGGAAPVSLQVAGDYAGDQFAVTSDGSGGTFVSLPCYVTGTRIRTTRGEVAVESLRVGDMAVTASGLERPIVWIGHRSLDLRRHAKPEAIMPVRVTAAAFGDNLPARDLWLSPRHAIYAGGILVPADRLLNGTTISQIARDSVTYWHVELESHDVLLAEGLPAESFLACGNRADFENGGVTLGLHPDFEPADRSGACAPFREFGPEVAALNVRLQARAEQFRDAESRSARAA